MSEFKGSAISNGVTLTKPPEQLTFNKSVASSPEETTGKDTPSGRHSMEPSLQCSSAWMCCVPIKLYLRKLHSH